MTGDVGIRLRKLRERRRLSRVALAGLVGHSERWLIGVEQGAVDIRLGHLRELARVLGVSVESLVSQESVKGDTLELEGDPAHRREFMALLAATGSGLLDLERLAAPVVDAAYLRDAESVTAALVGQWYSAQPAILLPPVLAHLSALRAVLPGPPALENLASRTALLGAHLFSKLRRFGDARSAYALGEGLSLDSGDTHVHALALVLRSGLHTWRKTADNRRALVLLNDAEANTRTGAPPLLRVGALARRAEERAAIGDEAGCLRDLDAAESALRPGTDHWYGARDVAELAAVRGACELLLGRHGDAASTLSWTLERMDPSAVNWRALVAADRDRALAAS